MSDKCIDCTQRSRRNSWKPIPQRPAKIGKLRAGMCIQNGQLHKQDDEHTNGTLITQKRIVHHNQHKTNECSRTGTTKKLRIKKKSNFPLATVYFIISINSLCCVETRNRAIVREYTKRPNWITVSRTYFGPSFTSHE